MAIFRRVSFDDFDAGLLDSGTDAGKVGLGLVVVNRVTRVHIGIDLGRNVEVIGSGHQDGFVDGWGFDSSRFGFGHSRVDYTKWIFCAEMIKARILS